MSIESVTTAALSAALDSGVRRQAAVAANIANANTVGYTPVKLSFGDEIAEARAAFQEQGSLQPVHLDALRGKIEEVFDASGQPARVQLDAEMSELASNAVHFQTLAQALSRHLGMLALAAADGRK